MRLEPVARGAAPAAAAPSPTDSAGRLALRGDRAEVPARAAASPRCSEPAPRPRAARARTSLQQVADGAGVLRQHRAPRHREQQLPALHALPRQHAVAGHGALPTHFHLRGQQRGRPGQSIPGPAALPPQPRAPLAHLRTQLQSHLLAPAQEASHGLRVAAAAAALRPRHLGEASSAPVSRSPGPRVRPGGKGLRGAGGTRGPGGTRPRDREGARRTPATARGTGVRLAPAAHPRALRLARHGRSRAALPASAAPPPGRHAGPTQAPEPRGARPGVRRAGAVGTRAGALAAA